MEPMLEAALKNIPGGDSVIEKFKLIFPSVTVIQLMVVVNLLLATVQVMPRCPSIPNTL